MGKRAKKKSNRAAPKVGQSPKVPPEQSSLSVDSVDQGVTLSKQRKLCTHIEKGFDLNELAEKVGSSDSSRCEDCREGVADRRGSKGKGKQGEKDSKSETKAIWFCLECGHYACGGVGMPTTQNSHAVRHYRQTRHPLVVQWRNPHLCWCFPCNMLLRVEKTEENGETKGALWNVVKLIKTQSSERSVVNVEDVWFGSGSVVSEIKAEGTVSNSLEGRSGYFVRGLNNLGNTCFFNSVMQNLLAMDKLRNYFFNEDASFGVLSISLKKLYAETKPQTGLKNVINPKSCFGSICARAPQFKGYQQQDSHELLRFLLDGLSTEELAVRKQVNASEEDVVLPKPGPTFVDAAFGGRISSTVCCVECGHSSTMYEPFLDLSLPLPTKKPPTKKFQPVSRAKKTKLPPKRAGRIRPKGNKDAEAAPARSTPSSSVDGNMFASSGDTPISDSSGATSVGDTSDLLPQNFSDVQETESKKAVDAVKTEIEASCADSWLEYLGPEITSNVPGCSSQSKEMCSSQHSEDKVIVSSDELTVTSQVSAVDPEPILKLDSSVNPWEEDVLSQVQCSEVLLLPYKEESPNDKQLVKGESEASSSVVGQGEADFDGFGDLFNEPEVSAGPVAGPSLRTGLMLGANSESDPDEVDNTGSPVSVESCLAHFIKTELLSDDNAWDCENCLKTLLRQRLEAKKSRAKALSEALVSGDEKQTQSDMKSLCKNISYPTEVRIFCNGDVSTDNVVNSGGENVVSDERIDCSNQIYMKAESGQVDKLKPFVSQCKDLKGEMCEQPNSSGLCESYIGKSLSGPAVDGYSITGYTIAKDLPGDSPSSENCESELDEDEDKASKILKVKRDATKKFLIDKAPPILTIHLKRFSQDARGRFSKLSGHVNFRERFDLRPYMDPRCPDIEKYEYRLLGVVEHSGTMRGGHYVAYVRGGERSSKGKGDGEDGYAVWYHASDAYVREVSLEEVLRSGLEEEKDAESTPFRTKLLLEQVMLRSSYQIVVLPELSKRRLARAVKASSRSSCQCVSEAQDSNAPKETLEDNFRPWCAW